MKISTFFPVFVLSLMAAQSSFADEAKPMFQKVYKNSDDSKIESLILQTYKSALKSSTKNQLQAEVARLQEELDDSGTVSEPTTHDLFRLSQGKGSAFQYGFTYLLGVPVSMKGTGMIEEYGRYVRVGIELNMAEGTVSVSLDAMADIADKK